MTLRLSVSCHAGQMPSTFTPSTIRSPCCALISREVTGVSTRIEGQCSTIAATSFCLRRTSFHGYLFFGTSFGRSGKMKIRFAPKVSNSLSTFDFRPTRAAITAVTEATPTIIPRAVSKDLPRSLGFVKAPGSLLRYRRPGSALAPLPTSSSTEVLNFEAGSSSIGKSEETRPSCNRTTRVQCDATSSSGSR